MSDRPCNYCHMKGIRRRAKRHDEEVVVVQSNQRHPLAEIFHRGVDVFVHPAGSSLNRDDHFVAYFAELPATCCC